MQNYGSPVINIAGIGDQLHGQSTCAGSFLVLNCDKYSQKSLSSMFMSCNHIKNHIQPLYKLVIMCKKIYMNGIVSEKYLIR